VVAVSNDLLSTGEVARLIGASRQHVVDLCDAGQMASFRVGKHRRVRRETADAYLADREHGRSIDGSHLLQLWSGRVQAAHVALDWGRARDLAAHRLAEMRGDNHLAWFADQWARVLEQGAEAVMETLTRHDEEAAVLQNTSPFIDLLSDDERARITDAFIEWWGSQRATA
jgi:excisionase family DNA binding protein